MSETTSTASKGIWQWCIVQLAVGLAPLSFAVIYALGGFDEESTRQCIRLSAKISVTLFCLAFSASAAHRLLHNSFSYWWRMNRKYFGISFAIVHLMHLGFLGILQGCFHPVFTLAKPTSLMAGGMAYLFLLLLLLTSFDFFARHLPAPYWKRLHLLGGWWIWAVFANSYGKRVLAGEWEYVPFALLVLAVAAMRWVRKRS